jgi:hypothetical protein
MFVLLSLLTCVEQGMSAALNREITQCMQQHHGVDKGVAVGFPHHTPRFFEFETCQGISFGQSVRLLSRDDAECFRCANHPAARLSSTSSQLTPHPSTAG